MKKLLATVCLSIFLFSANCLSQVASPYAVGTWQGFRSAAVSYTFDDNCPNQQKIAVPMFNEFGFKLTLFAVTANTGWAWTADWTKLQAAADQGHEVASHTVTHPNITGLAYASQYNEFKNAKDTIESRIIGKKCVTMAYPYCETGYDTLVSRYYLAARICSGSTEPKTPSNFMRISSIICGSLGVNTSAAFKSRVDNAAVTKGWVVYLFHGINNDEPNSPYSPIAEDTLRKSLEYLKANPDKFWVAPFGTVAKYIRERNAASVSEISATGDTIVVSVTDTMDNSIYDTPITVRRALPESWINAIALQNGDTLYSKRADSATVKYFMFDVVPDNGNVTLIRTNTTGVDQGSIPSLPGSFELHQNYPNPFNPGTIISYYVPRGQNVEIKVFDMIGNEIATLVKEFKNAGFHTVKFSKGNLSSGVYFYRLQAETYTSTKKLILLK